MSLTRLSLGRNNLYMTSLFPPRESLVSDIPAGDGNIQKVFLRCKIMHIYILHCLLIYSIWYILCYCIHNSISYWNVLYLHCYSLYVSVCRRCTAALLKLRTLISVHIIRYRKTKLSMERKMFPLCGPSKYICISVVFRHLQNFPEVFRKFSEISGGFSEISRGFPQ